MSINIIKIEEMLNDNQYNLLISYLKTCQLESLSHNTIIHKIIDQLDRQSNYSILRELLELFVMYPNEIFPIEIMEGLKCFIKHSNDYNCIYLLLCLLIEKKKTIDPDIMIEALNVLLNKSKDNDKRQYNTMIENYVEINRDLPHSFWEKIINFFQTHFQYEIVDQLLNAYPLIYSSSESYWKKMINCSDLIIQSKLFNIFYGKYIDRKPNENLSSYTTIFNYFLKAIADFNTYTDDDIPLRIFNMILGQNIQIEADILNQFLINYCKANLSNGLLIKDLLIKSSTNITSSIVSNILNLIYSTGDLGIIIDLLKLIKSREIKAEYDLLQLDSNLMKEVIFYMINHSDKKSISVDLRSQLSDSNWEYLSKLDENESFEIL